MQADPQGRWVPAQLPQELLRSVPERLRGRLSLAPLAGAADGHKKGDSDSAALQRLCGRLSLAPAAEVFGGSGGGINPSALASLSPVQRRKLQLAMAHSRSRAPAPAPEAARASGADADLGAAAPPAQRGDAHPANGRSRGPIRHGLPLQKDADSLTGKCLPGACQGAAQGEFSQPRPSLCRAVLTCCSHGARGGRLLTPVTPERCDWLS